MYSNVVLDLDHDMFEEILDEQRNAGRQRRHRSAAEDWEEVVADYKAAVERDSASRSRRTRRTSSGARSAPSSPAG